MKKSIIVFTALVFLFSAKTIAQEKESAFDVKVSGFIKSDFFYDSRQIVSAREGHFLLWPKPELLDDNGSDINAKSNFNILSIHSRITMTVTGPDALGAKTTGVMEGDFFATQNIDVNEFRMRHAFLKLNWTKTELLLGQYWNPLFVTGCFPGTASFNTGTPMQSFARNPQIRITHGTGNLKFLLVAASQRDHRSTGPSGPSSDYLRNAVVPDLHFQIHYGIKNEQVGSDVLFGAGIAHKTIVPRLSSTVGAETFKVNEKVSGTTAIGFAKVALRPITIKVQGRYGENISDLLSISGYAEKRVTDHITGQCAWTPLTSTTFWTDIHSNGKKAQVGIFAGYLKNNGSKEELSDADNAVFGFGQNIESLYRISPRLVLNYNKVKIGTEIEYTSAAYGKNFNTFYKPSNTTTVANTRILVSVGYYF